MAKSAKKSKLTDADRHERFKEMARQVGASTDPKAFDQAFKKVTARPGVWVKTGIKIGTEDKRPKDKKP